MNHDVLPIEQSLHRLIEVVTRKYAYHSSAGHDKRTDPEVYLQGLIDEVTEVRDEVKHENYVYLEEECGDLIWGVLNVLMTLQQSGMICSLEDVFTRAYHKYHERTDFDTHEPVGHRTTIKNKQKQALRDEHEAAFGQ